MLIKTFLMLVGYTVKFGAANLMFFMIDKIL